jgi:electron transport complex protein RnfD
MAFSFKLTPPFISAGNRVTDHMLMLGWALIPALIALTFFFGPGVLINILLASIVALITEAVMLKMRDRPIKAFLTDGSAVVTAVLLAIAIPPLSPWWLTVVGIIFAIVFAKHLFGGLGYNPFNPAMVAYVLLLISFPVEMTRWLPVAELNNIDISFTTAFQVIFTEQSPYLATIDAISGATPLDIMKTQIGLQQTPDMIQQGKAFGFLAGQGWQWINIWFAVGGLFLLYRKVISWHIPIAVLAGLTSISLVTWLITPETTASPLFHLLSGGTMIGAFFIATDPVSASTTVKGRLIYGAGIGFLTYIIRVWGGYPDGIAFAVLLMNMLVPLIDDVTQPRVYGAKQ